METKELFKKYGLLGIIYHLLSGTFYKTYKMLYVYYSEDNNKYAVCLEKENDKDTRIYKVITEKEAKDILLKDLNKRL